MKSLGYIVFVVGFLIEVGATALHPQAVYALTPWQLALVAFAAFRVARSISYNMVFAWARSPFVQVIPDSSGAGDSVVPNDRLHPFLYAIGDCIACPICTGTHAASILLALIALAGDYGLIFAYALALAGGSETLHWLTEKWEWQGRYAREQSGSEWMMKNPKENWRVQ